METEALRAALRTAGDEFKEARRAHDAARTKVLPLIRDALANDDITQREVADLTGYTRESLRILAKGANPTEPHQ